MTPSGLHTFDPKLAARYWYDALEAEIGVIITLTSSDDIRVVQNQLYEARQATGDPDLGCLSLVLLNGGKEIMLIKQSVELEP